MELHKKLKHYRKLSNKTQIETARIVRMSSNYLSLIEKGTKKPSTKLLWKLAKFYNVSPSILLENEEYSFLKEFNLLSESKKIKILEYIELLKK